MSQLEVKPPVAAQPLYPHTLSSQPTIQTQADKVDIDALFDKHQLVAEFDAVRGVDAVHQP